MPVQPGYEIIGPSQLIANAFGDATKNTKKMGPAVMSHSLLNAEKAAALS